MKHCILFILFVLGTCPIFAKDTLGSISIEHKGGGHSVDSGRTSGDVTVKNGVEYEIEASGTVTLESGFNVEKGATFAVYPSSF